jgi:hypothetical protein
MKPIWFILFQTYVAQGQSSFWFNNYNLPAVNAPVFDAQGIPLEGPNYVAELWGGSEPGSLTPTLAYYSAQRVIIPFRNGGSAGIVRDSYVNRDPADHPTILGVSPYVGLVWLQVRAWDLRLGVMENLHCSRLTVPILGICWPLELR